MALRVWQYFRRHGRLEFGFLAFYLALNSGLMLALTLMGYAVDWLGGLAMAVLFAAAACLVWRWAREP